MMSRTYSEMAQQETFLGRFDYLALKGEVGQATFGSERYLNQQFYNSKEWKDARDLVIIRDDGRDLGIVDREIHGKLYVHHINPITPEDLRFGRYVLVDPENLITVSHETHNAIHYGDASLLAREPIERTPGDTKLW